jgi:hypothetical protein
MSRRCALTLLASGVALGLILSAGVAGAAKQPTESSIESAISQVPIASSKIPSFTPSLVSISSAGGVYKAQGSSLSEKCDPMVSETLAIHPEPCWFGDLQSEKVVVLIGDSNAGNWTPALSGALKELHLKLAAFIYPGCTSQFIVFTAKNFPNQSAGGNYARCNLFHRKVVEVVNALRPFAVISAQLGEGYSGKSKALSVFAADWKSTFARLTSANPNALRIMLGTTPVEPVFSIPVCLSRFSASVASTWMTSCSPHYYPGDYRITNLSSYLQRDQISATAADAKLIPTYKWFCTFQNSIKDYCPAVINHTLVYVDTDHISIAYMTSLVGVLKGALVNAGL